MTRAQRQSGVMLIEAMIGILIFAIGILALVAMQATAIRAAQDSRYRTEAVNYANDLLSQMLVNINRSNAATFKTSVESFIHQASGADCAFSGAASTNTVVTDWAALVTNNQTQVTLPVQTSLAGVTSGTAILRAARTQDGSTTVSPSSVRGVLSSTSSAIRTPASAQASTIPACQSTANHSFRAAAMVGPTPSTCASCSSLAARMASIDPKAVAELKTLIRGLAHKGIGVLVTDHNVRETLSICDRAYIIHLGVLLLHGSPREIAESDEARAVYLGEEFSLPNTN